MRTYRRALNVGLVTMLGAAIYVSASTHEAPALSGPGGIKQEAPTNVPTFEKSDRKTGCIPTTGEFADVVLVVKQDATRVLMSFDEAYERTHNDTKADDIWVIGICL